MYYYEALNFQSSKLDKLALQVRLDRQLHELHFNIKSQQKLRRFSN